jgi:uncharacterized protein YidB (DUF937 family)
MGLLDQVLGNVLGSRRGGAGRGGMSPLMTALMALLASRAFGQGRSGESGGGLGDVLGGGSGRVPPQAESFDESGAGPTDFSDLGGALDPDGNAGAGQYANMDETGPNADGGFLGGLGSLIERFTQSGHRDAIESWIGRGENRPIRPNELADALGPDTIDSLSRRTGMPRDELLSELSQTLPDAVDQLTPEGRMPNEDEMRRW